MTELDEVQNELEEIKARIKKFHLKNEEMRQRLARFQWVKPESPNDDKVHFNDRLIYQEMERREIALSFIPETEVVVAKFGLHIELLYGATSRLIPHAYHAILQDKFITKQLFKKYGYPVAEGKVFAQDEINEALNFAAKEIGFPAIIKATQESGGKSIYCDIQSEVEFRRAYHEINQTIFKPSILVEKFLAEVDDYRFFLVNGKVISVVKRTPPSIIGDGHSTFQELVTTENNRRINPRTTCLCPIQIRDLESEKCLKQQGICLDTIVPQGIPVRCRLNANVSTGGGCETVTNQIHSSYSDIAEDLMKLFPGLSILVIDFLIKDSSLAAAEGNYWICESCCVNPGLSLHTHPGTGVGDDIITPIVDLIFPETAALV